MNFVNFKDAVPFGKPADWDERTMGPCGALPVKRGAHGCSRTFTSYWRPDERDLAVLLAGGAIEFTAYGVQPAISMAVVPTVEGEIVNGT